jgi:hypothetical protein
MKGDTEMTQGDPRGGLEIRVQGHLDSSWRDDEVLVRVHAASVHLGDWILIRGVPYIARMAVGLRKPKCDRYSETRPNDPEKSATP